MFVLIATKTVDFWCISRSDRTGKKTGTKLPLKFQGDRFDDSRKALMENVKSHHVISKTLIENETEQIELNPHVIDLFED